MQLPSAKKVKVLFLFLRFISQNRLSDNCMHREHFPVFHLFHLSVQTKTLGHILLGVSPTPAGIDSSLRQGTDSRSSRKKKVRGTQEQCLWVSNTCYGAEHGGAGSAAVGEVRFQ